MTTEHICSALSDDGEVFELMTCGAPLMVDAYAHFIDYIIEMGGTPETLAAMTINAVDMELLQ